MVGALYGASAMASLAVGLVFLRHWRQTTDRLFLMFAAAFGILAVQYSIIAVTALGAELRPYVYGVRLLAFGLIVYAIAEKNRARRV
jgi:hypothetical protein